jgi:hypothetical protein
MEKKDRTKWEIMQDRLLKAELVVRELYDEIEWAQSTPFTANGTGVCSYCQTPLPTEADFWKHYPVPDERYINLGYCPKDPNGRGKALS